ncbi:hypothetical protein Tco_0691323 [Tanacetum coccineum]
MVGAASTAARLSNYHERKTVKRYMWGPYGISEDLHPELLVRGDRIVDFPEGKIDMDLFNLVSALNPSIIKTGTRQRAAHEITNQEKVGSQISAETAQEVSPVGETITSGFVPETNLEREVSGMGAQENKERRKRDMSDTEANTPPKVLRTDHASVHPAPNTRSGKS